MAAFRALRMLHQLPSMFLISLCCSTTMLPTTTDYYDYSSDTAITPCRLDTADTLGLAFRPVLLWSVFVAGVLGNGLVLWVLLQRRVRTMADVCLLNLAVADLLLALLLPLWTRTFAGEGLAEAALCKAMAGLYQLGFTSGLLFVTLMSLDRYLAIVHAVSSSAVRKLRYSLLVSGGVWAVAITVALIKAVFTISEEGKCFVDYPAKNAATWKLVHNFVEISLCLGICLPVLTFCYVRILMVVRRQRSSKKGRAVRLIFAIVCVFAVFWVPYYVTVLLQTLHGELHLWEGCEMSQQLAVAVEVTEIITLMHCCVNPVVYAFMGEKFRKGFALAIAGHPLCMKLCPRTDLVMSTFSKPSDDTSNTAVSSRVD